MPMKKKSVPPLVLTENVWSNDTNEDWFLQNWKKQRLVWGPVPFGPDEIMEAAASAWRGNCKNLQYIESKTYKTITRKNGRQLLNLIHIVEDLEFDFDFYIVKPKKSKWSTFLEKVGP